MKKTLEDIFAWHDFSIAARTQYADKIVVERDMHGDNQALHPVVRTHLNSGKKSLFVNPGFTSHLDGFTYDESSVILKFLYDHCTKPEFIYRHTWKKGDLLIWDNRVLMHYAIMDYPDDQGRYMERCTVIGEKPF